MTQIKHLDHRKKSWARVSKKAQDMGRILLVKEIVNMGIAQDLAQDFRKNLISNYPNLEHIDSRNLSKIREFDHANGNNKDSKEKMRKCLGHDCGRMFLSHSAGNRICGTCKADKVVFRGGGCMA